MSTLNVSNISDGTDTVETGYVVNGSAKAWVNFNGTGTIATRDSFNVSSLTDVGAGQYRINFSNSMANTGYSFATTNRINENIVGSVAAFHLTTSIELQSRATTSTGTETDTDYVCGIIQGDLA